MGLVLRGLCRGWLFNMELEKMNGNDMIEQDDRENLSGLDDFEEWVAEHEQAYFDGKMDYLMEQDKPAQPRINVKEQYHGQI